MPRLSILSFSPSPCLNCSFYSLADRSFAGYILGQRTHVAKAAFKASRAVAGEAIDYVYASAIYAWVASTLVNLCQENA